ncbi:hypothetical protein KI387_029399, partial [Taxus chinensis]
DPDNGSKWELNVGLGTGVADYGGRGFTGGGVGWSTGLVFGMVLGVGCICLGMGIVEELAMEGLVGLTTLLEGSRLLALGYVFLADDDT